VGLLAFAAATVKILAFAASEVFPHPLTRLTKLKTSKAGIDRRPRFCFRIFLPMENDSTAGCRLKIYLLLLKGIRFLRLLPSFKNLTEKNTLRFGGYFPAQKQETNPAPFMFPEDEKSAG
jgi:hypothetical protein